jgi:hypothetical protein
MPDRLRAIQESLENLEAMGGLGGGGGGTDVSALATEVTLADVVTNTAATTTAIETLETNVITASGVQTLSLNSATSAQTTSLTTAMGGIARETTASSMVSKLTSIEGKLTSDALTQTDILGATLDCLAEITNVLSEIQRISPIVNSFTEFPVTLTTDLVYQVSNAAANRGLFTCFNNTNQTVYLCFVDSSSNPTKASAVVGIPPEGYYEMPKPYYTGAISAVFTSVATGNLRVTQTV